MKNYSKLSYLAPSFLVSGTLLFGAIVNAHGPGQGDPNGNLEPLTAEIAQGEFGIVLEPVADGLIAPLWGVAPPGLSGRLFVNDQDGIIWNVDLSDGSKTVFADFGDRLVPLGAFGPGSFDERGLLGIAFHPDYASNGLFYTYTSEPNAGPADFSTMPVGIDANHQSVVAEWQVMDPSDSTPSVMQGSFREMLRIDQPQFNHDGGSINFSPNDGMLYIALGDGGGADDEAIGHGVNGNGQDPSNPLGAILRIDPQGSDSSNGQYGIPYDNPFIGQPGYLPEIYAYGFRNPFRISFDSVNGDLFAADVGQNDIEEVDLVVSGGNYGWRLKEGSFFFDKDGDRNGFGFAGTEDPGGLPGDLIDPVAEYDTHIEGHSVIGGFVYRGSQFPELEGKYIFGEFAKTVFFGSGIFTWARIFYLDENAPNGVTEFHYAGGVQRIPYALFGFGQDDDGELYFLGNTTGVPFGAGENLDEPTGVILKIVSVDE